MVLYLGTSVPLTFCNMLYARGVASVWARIS